MFLLIIFQGNYDKAQACLEQAIEDHYSDRSKWKTNEHSGSDEERLACAKVHLPLGCLCFRGGLSIMISITFSELSDILLMEGWTSLAIWIHFVE